MKKYYVHKDGRVFLVEKDNLLCLPSREQLPFEVENLRKINCRGKVYFCNPKINRFPEDWTRNDKLIFRDDVHKEVKEAFLYSLARNTSLGIALNERNEVLMVYGNRGLSEGFWNLPGGFVEYGEHPRECLVREVFEETGYRASVKKLHGVYSHTWKDSTPGYNMICTVYLLKLGKRTGDIDKTEISKMKYLPITEGIRKTESYFVEKALQDLSDKLD